MRSPVAHIIFYEKPGCAGNARQKALLIASGHQVEARNLLSEPWSVSSLRPYFAAMPVREWFNAASPRIRSGEIDPESMNPQEALMTLILDPTLIRRPLMRIGDHCEAGFDPGRVSAWVGLEPDAVAAADGCAHMCENDAA